MVSESEINHAKAIQGVCMIRTSGLGLLNYLFFLSFSHSCSKESWGQRDRSMVWLHLFLEKKKSLHLGKESWLHVCLISRSNHNEIYIYIILIPV